MIGVQCYQVDQQFDYVGGGDIQLWQFLQFGYVGCVKVVGQDYVDFVVLAGVFVELVQSGMVLGDVYCVVGDCIGNLVGDVEFVQIVFVWCQMDYVGDV